MVVSISSVQPRLGTQDMHGALLPHVQQVQTAAGNLLQQPESASAVHIITTVLFRVISSHAHSTSAILVCSFFLSQSAAAKSVPESAVN